VLKRGSIFTDPLALRILGEGVETVARLTEERPDGRGRRIFIAARTRFAESALEVAMERGVSQLVVLGAGLNTYAYRGALRERLRI
jgi:O-methyltransferase involved in polyketide biosynthesis